MLGNKEQPPLPPEARAAAIQFVRSLADEMETEWEIDGTPEFTLALRAVANELERLTRP